MIVISHVVALSNNNVIGINNDLPWNLKKDLAHFKEYTNKKINTFVSIFPTTKPKFVLAVMLEEPKINKDYIYNYRDGSNFKLKGSPRNTAGWNSVEATGHIIEKIGPILATKYSEVN